MMYSWSEVRPKPLHILTVTFGLLLFGSIPFIIPAHASASSIDIWWPVSGSHVSGTQPFKAMIPGMDAGSYDLYWRVGNGQWVPMPTNDTGYPHKEASVDLSGWTWQGSGPYVIEFSARENGVEIASASTQIVVDNGLPENGGPASQTQASQTSSTNTSSVAPQSAPAPLKMNTAQTVSVNPLASSAFYAGNADATAASQAAALSLLAETPTATWFGDWNTDVESGVHTLVSQAAAAGKEPVLVAYDIPERDCGSYSAGGASSPDAYRSWIDQFAQGIGTDRALVILEPDALADMDCLSSADQSTRLSLISYAVGVLKKNPETEVYIDAGHSDWIDAGAMAHRLEEADISQADGFSLNVSNFLPTTAEENYGAQISADTSGKHFVIDTSRNGAATDGSWCNPTGAAIGHAPTTNTGDALVDAFLWVKVPGESDGACNGGPAAGQWWLQGALNLVLNAHTQ